MNRSTTTAALVALCAGVFAQAFGSMRQKSLAYDELAYIPAGYSDVVTGDFRLNPEQPLLMKRGGTRVGWVHIHTSQSSQVAPGAQRREGLPGPTL
jgi:hypothetical protein